MSQRAPGTTETISEADLWRRAYVAENASEAQVQTDRQFATVSGKAIAVTRLTGELGNEGWREFDLTAPVVVHVFDIFNGEADWDGEVTYPEWRVRADDPTAVVTTTDGDHIRLGDIDYLGYSAPGIGTAAGYTNHDPSDLIHPDPQA